ncbi:deoxyribose-phosphate aldolase [Corynebacterium aurimucosum]|uniref:deoxyribose-phosphate aldolase n=1 Tax=Corynebacterium aurimucosum TaxID=169292 RepID=UPI00191D183C|nr:deoxyribose-phosphate aldolase [Corynebacterium aurimucosum]QQU95461.1 deoxyribose-phosphate aldolase [Corynebacterium aurimucosum]UTA71637.1 deoxyribose-phosphate aldolase [Corynebacterium aurimucosum]WJY69870.1 Deoxyribose-phosphate aldolase 2 [Corynebacterium aurimucosum]
MRNAQLIDHTLLKPTAQATQIDTLIAEAKEHGFASVCVNPTWVARATEQLAGTEVKVCTVIGFPLGANTSEVKAFEARDAIAKGASEVDMVINVGAALDGDWDAVESDIKAVVDAAEGSLVKVILETCYLDAAQIKEASTRAVAAGADFVKTSTGFGTGGATIEHVALMREVVGPEIGVKASGGVRTAEDMAAMVAAGATRIGTSNGVSLV